jgi:DNA-binding LacI/PurR family transcriptional regulator
MAALLDRHPDLDAVFVASDLMASGALQTLRERGRRVPEDVAVVGFDDLTAISETTDPPLTTVHQDVAEMGRLLARLLFSRTEQDPGQDLPSAIVPTRLVVRQSA